MTPGAHIRLLPTPKIPVNKKRLGHTYSLFTSTILLHLLLGLLSPSVVSRIQAESYPKNGGKSKEQPVLEGNYNPYLKNVDSVFRAIGAIERF